MKIMILVASFPPKIDSASRLYSELAESLCERGHYVTVVTDHPNEGDAVDNLHEYFIQKPSKSVINGVKVQRISPLSFLSKIPGGKAIRFILSLAMYAYSGILTHRIDAILVYSPPLFMGISGYIISMFKNARLVLNMQDIHPKVLIDSGIINNNIIKHTLLKMETFCYSKADSIIVYSSGNMEYLRSKRVKTKIFIIPNWIDISKYKHPITLSPLFNEKGIESKFIVSYAGTLGLEQDLGIIIGAAMKLRDYEEILFVIAGDGPSKYQLREKINTLKLNNVLILPTLGKSGYEALLSQTKIGLVTLGTGVPKETVPGKIADLMAHGKPIIGSMYEDGDAAREITRALCGVMVAPGDNKALAQAVVTLFRQNDERKRMGIRARQYADKFLSREVCTARYESVLLQSAVMQTG